MESASGYKYKLIDLENALRGFKELLDEDISMYSPRIIDAIQNGQLQKCEYCIELLWKTTKEYLKELNGIEIIYPKQAFKELFLQKVISPEEYEILNALIDDRNRMAHIYKKEQYQDILSRLPVYLKTMMVVFLMLKK